MSNIIKRNYKWIIGLIIFIISLPVVPVLLEIIFKFGNLLGTYARNIGSCL